MILNQVKLLIDFVDYHDYWNMKSLAESIFDKNLVTKHLSVVTFIINKLKEYPEKDNIKVTEKEWMSWFNEMTKMLYKNTTFYSPPRVNKLDEDHCLIGLSTRPADKGSLYILSYFGESKPWLFVFDRSSGIQEIYCEVYAVQNYAYWGIVKKVSWGEYEFNKETRENFKEMINSILKVF